MDTRSALRASTSDEWKYLAEGGAHLVFAYRGSSPLLQNKVIRARKDRLGGTSKEQQKTSFDVARDHLSRQVIPSLVPHQLLPADDRIAVKADWLQELIGDSVNLRPASRLTPGSDHSIPVPMHTLDNDAIEVSLVENLLGGEGDLAIEIKPKCGFLPSAQFLSDDSRAVKTRRCRFCMHRLLRANERSQADNAQTRGKPDSSFPTVRDTGQSSDSTQLSDQSRWDYCPLDLYSLDRQRRIHAVTQLYASWQATSGEGNNMRLFASGIAIRPTGSPVDRTTDTNPTDSIESNETVEPDDAARGQTSGNTMMELPEQLRDQLCASIVDALDDALVLPLLKALQQEFDPIGIEGLGQLANQGQLDQKVTNPAEPHHAGSTNVFPESLLADPSIAELEAVKQFWLASLASAPTSTDQPLDELSESMDIRTLLVFHGISAIFKDCSIIIRFPEALRNQVVQSSLDPSLEFDLVNGPEAILKIIDLDLKPMKKANKWYELDDRIWRNAVREELCEDGALVRRRCVS